MTDRVWHRILLLCFLLDLVSGGCKRSSPVWQPSLDSAPTIQVSDARLVTITWSSDQLIENRDCVDTFDLGVVHERLERRVCSLPVNPRQTEYRCQLDLVNFKHCGKTFGFWVVAVNNNHTRGPQRIRTYSDSLLHLRCNGPSIVEKKKSSSCYALSPEWSADPHIEQDTPYQIRLNWALSDVTYGYCVDHFTLQIWESGRFNPPYNQLKFPVLAGEERYGGIVDVTPCRSYTYILSARFRSGPAADKEGVIRVACPGDPAHDSAQHKLRPSEDLAPGHSPTSGIVPPATLPPKDLVNLPAQDDELALPVSSLPTTPANIRSTVSESIRDNDEAPLVIMLPPTTPANTRNTVSQSFRDDDVGFPVSLPPTTLANTPSTFSQPILREKAALPAILPTTTSANIRSTVSPSTAVVTARMPDSSTFENEVFLPRAVVEDTTRPGLTMEAANRPGFGEDIAIQPGFVAEQATSKPGFLVETNMSTGPSVEAAVKSNRTMEAAARPGVVQKVPKPIPRVTTGAGDLAEVISVQGQGNAGSQARDYYSDQTATLSTIGQAEGADQSPDQSLTSEATFSVGRGELGRSGVLQIEGIPARGRPGSEGIARALPADPVHMGPFVPLLPDNHYQDFIEVKNHGEVGKRPLPGMSNTEANFGQAINKGPKEINPPDLGAEQLTPLLPSTEKTREVQEAGGEPPEVPVQITPERDFRTLADQRTELPPPFLTHQGSGRAGGQLAELPSSPAPRIIDSSMRPSGKLTDLPPWLTEPRMLPPQTQGGGVQQVEGQPTATKNLSQTNNKVIDFQSKLNGDPGDHMHQDEESLRSLGRGEASRLDKFLSASNRLLQPPSLHHLNATQESLTFMLQVVDDTGYTVDKYQVACWEKGSIEAVILPPCCTAEEVTWGDGPTYSRPMTVPALRPNTTYSCQAGMLVEGRWLFSPRYLRSTIGSSGVTPTSALTYPLLLLPAVLLLEQVHYSSFFSCF